MYIAPVEFNNDPRLLGQGSSKMVWKLDDFAVINAYDRQRFDGLTGTQEQKIKKSNVDIMMEYNFTLYLHSIFPTLIPKVYLFKDPYPFEDNKFRYVKDLCTKIKTDNDVFDKLILVSDTLLDKGWVYLDIKPDNIAETNGQLSIMDTDYRSLYRVPEPMIPDFRMWVYLIVLILSYNYLRVNHSILIQFIKEKGITKDTLGQLEKNWDETRKEIAQYGNETIVKDKADAYIQLEESDIANPFMFFSAYGKRGDKSEADRFSELIELANKPSVVPAKRPTVASKTGSNTQKMTRPRPTSRQTPKKTPRPTPKRRTTSNPIVTPIAAPKAEDREGREFKSDVEDVAEPKKAALFNPMGFFGTSSKR
jgi:hypothetical protein